MALGEEKRCEATAYHACANYSNGANFRHFALCALFRGQKTPGLCILYYIYVALLDLRFSQPQLRVKVRGRGFSADAY